MTSGPANRPWAIAALRWVAFLALLYLFLVAIELFGMAMKQLGDAQAKQLFVGLSNPFAGLAVGVLATVLVQSSSATTSWVVAMVGAGFLSVGTAVPVVMGANIGTSITNTLVSLVYGRRNEEFRRAFAGATVHDFFNLLTVVILFPIELATGFLQKAAEWLSANIPVGVGGKFKSPIKEAVKALAKSIRSIFEDGLGLQGATLSFVLFVIALVLVIGTLILITKNMKLLMADRIERWLNRVLTRSGLLGLIVGVVITAAVQSSSITTSLLVPMFGAGVLTLEAGFPLMVGANIGTTITALIAALVAGPAGLTIALVHLLFNLCGTAMFFGIRGARRLPIVCAQRLADLAVENRAWVVAYIVLVFVVIPLAGILL